MLPAWIAPTSCLRGANQDQRECAVSLKLKRLRSFTDGKQAMSCCMRKSNWQTRSSCRRDCKNIASCYLFLIDGCISRIFATVEFGTTRFIYQGENGVILNRFCSEQARLSRGWFVE